MIPPPPQPIALPRALIVLAFFWLVASWLLAIGLKPPLHPSPASYEPGVKMMMISLTVGLMIGWPLFRLSQTRSPWPIRQTILDLVVLLSMVQVVLWPLRLVTTWTRDRTAAMDATIAGWAILIGAVIAASIGSSRQGPRTLGMVAAVAICLLGPAAAWLGLRVGVEAFDLIGLSALLSVHTLADGHGGLPTREQWQLIGLLGVAAIAAWSALGIVTVVSNRRKGLSGD